MILFKTSFFLFVRRDIVTHSYCLLCICFSYSYLLDLILVGHICLGIYHFFLDWNAVFQSILQQASGFHWSMSVSLLLSLILLIWVSSLPVLVSLVKALRPLLVFPKNHPWIIHDFFPDFLISCHLLLFGVG